MMKFTSQDTDQQLLLGCRSDDRFAQRYLYERYGGRLLAIPMCYTSNRDEAIEILNTAFFKIFQSIHHYQPTHSLGAWMSKIIFYATIDQVRKNISHSKTTIYNDGFPENAIENDALSDLAVEELYELVQQLPPATQAVFSLYAVDGYKHQEIAEMLKISIGTSKWHLAEARKMLKEKLVGLNC
jgi:RNA polymerase sigma factor (sigma-70 family)